MTGIRPLALWNDPASAVDVLGLRGAHAIHRGRSFWLGCLVLATILLGQIPRVAADPPPNGSCTSAETIAGQGLFPFDNSHGYGLTFGGGDGCNSYDFVINDVWYCWTSPCDGDVTIDTMGTTTVQTKLIIYDGCGCPASGAIACDDSITPEDQISLQAGITFYATAGAQYLIQLGSTPEPKVRGGVGELTIECAPAPAPVCSPPEADCTPDDPFGTCCQTPTLEDALRSDATSATVAHRFATIGDQTVEMLCWWGVYADGTAYCSPDQPDQFEVRYYADDNGLPGALLAGPFRSSDSTLFDLQRSRTGRYIPDAGHEYEFSAKHAPFDTMGGTCYWIEITNALEGTCVWHWSTTASRRERSVQDGRLTGAPDGFDLTEVITESMSFCIDAPLEDHPICLGAIPNDTCATGLPLPDGDAWFDTLGATTDEDAQPECDYPLGDELIHQDIWFDHVASCTGTLTVDLAGSGFDTKVSIYEGTTCPPANSPVACNDDGHHDGDSVAARVAVPVTQGAAYKVRIGGFKAEDGVGVVRVDCGAPPAMNDCADAVAAPIPLIVSGSNLHADHDCDLMPGGHTWIALHHTDGARSVQLSYEGSTPVFYDAWRNLVVGCPCESLSEPGVVSVAPDDNPVITWALLPTGTYYYPVLSEPGSQGDYQIEVSYVDLPDPCVSGTGDCFSAHDTPGCENAAYCEHVCLLLTRSAARTHGMTTVRVWRRVSHIRRSAQSARRATEPCESAHDAPGCDDPDLCAFVCHCDPYCCFIGWDEYCAGSGYWANPPACGGANGLRCGR